jgi:hypothetical protein
MNPEEQAAHQPAYDPKQKVGAELTVQQEGERMICEIKRHPIGIIAIYIATGVILVAVALLVFAALPALTADSAGADSIKQISAYGFALLLMVSAIYGLIATIVYWGNRWIVTSDSVTQITQTSLFHRESAQLSLAHIEDITAEQNGITTHIFNYGVLKAETAGHLEKFMFLYCPNPNYYATEILKAREAFEMHMHGTENRTPPPPPAY